MPKSWHSCLVAADSTDDYADGVRAAAAQLLAACPELRVDWDDLRADYDANEDAADVGLYTIIGQIVKPRLGRALGLPEDLLRNHEHWRENLAPVSAADGDLARRIYEVLEEWASSPSDGVVEAVGVEFGGGWGGWTADVSLHGPAGPILKQLIGPGSPYVY